MAKIRCATNHPETNEVVYVEKGGDALAELIERMSVLVTRREFFLSGKTECSADWINAKRALARVQGEG